MILRIVLEGETLEHGLVLPVARLAACQEDEP